jgi:hypothetical protein
MPIAGTPGQRYFLGIYHHPPDPELGITGREVKDTWTNEAVAFASSFAAKSALWLIRFPP